MNNDGDFFIGNKKVSSATGQEEVFDAPIPSVTGEDVGDTGVSVGFDVLTPLEVTISRSIRVEGGPDGNIISEFDGPVIFNNKVTSTSLVDLHNSLFLQGTQQFLETTPLASLNQHLGMLVMLYSMLILLRVDTLDGSIPLTIIGLDLVMSVLLRQNLLESLIESALAPQHLVDVS